MIHRYRQTLFYSVLVFLFILTFSLWSDKGAAEQLRSDISEDLEETGSGGGGFYRASEDITPGDDENTEDGDNDITEVDDVAEPDSDGVVTPVRLDTRSPNHGFWPEDAQCSKHR